MKTFVLFLAAAAAAVLLCGLMVFELGCATGRPLSGTRDGLGAPEAFQDAQTGAVCYVMRPLFWPFPWGPGASIVCIPKDGGER